jgi:hypothetical protein
MQTLKGAAHRVARGGRVLHLCSADCARMFAEAARQEVST